MTVYDWKRKHFNHTQGGGVLVGKNNVENILLTRELSGCHDHALLVASVLRSAGHPVIMVDTAGIDWARQYRQGKAQGHWGHVFLELYDGAKWLVLDSTRPIVIRNYDPQNCFIPITNPIEPVGFYTMLKGIDPDDYGVHSLEDLYLHMNRFAAGFKVSNIDMPNYDIEILK